MIFEIKTILCVSSNRSIMQVFVAFGAAGVHSMNYVFRIASEHHHVRDIFY